MQAELHDREMRQLADRIYELRDRRGWSQVELARRSGLSRTTIWNIESGGYSPSMTTLSKIASAFGMNVFRMLDTATPLPRLEDLPMGKVVGPAD